MDAREYQIKAHEFADYNSGHKEEAFRNFIYPVMGLGEEAGEVQGKFAKVWRDKGGHFDEESLKAVKKELGDVMWFVAEICTCIGVHLEDIMEGNIEKLTDRKARGKINGSGDER